MAAQFQAAHPDVKVNLSLDHEIEAITTTRIAAGEWPDVGYFAFDASVERNRELLDITDIFDSDIPDRPGTKIRDYVLDGTLESTPCSPYGDGRIYDAPFNASPTGLVYNKNLFETKGWKVPTTWDEFFALGKELEKTENYVTVNGQRVKRSLFTYQGIYPGYLEMLVLPNIASAAGDAGIKNVYAYKPGSFSVPGVRQVLTNMAKIGREGYLMPGTAGLSHTQSQSDFLMGKALFIPCGDWIVNEMKDAPREPGFSFGMTFGLIIQASQQKYVPSSLERWSIPKAAKNIPLAKEFIKFLYTRKSVESFAKNAGGVFAVKDAAEIGKQYLSEGVYNMNAVYRDGKFFLIAFEPLPANTKINPIHVIWENIGLLINGSVTLDAYTKLVEDAFTEVTQDRARAN